MKYTYLNFLCSFFLFGIIGSCTITKRVHNPGWHVEWKSNHSRANETALVAADVSKTERHTPNESVSPQEFEVSRTTDENLYFPENSTFSDQQDPQAVKTGEAIRVEQGAAKTSKLDEEKEEAFSKNEEPGAKKVHPLAKAALISLILSLVTFGLGMLVAIILSRIALKKIKSDPEHWTGRKMALTVLIISSVLFVPLMLLILIISLSFNYSSGGWL
jgi:hypothetical protein